MTTGQGGAISPSEWFLTPVQRGVTISVWGGYLFLSNFTAHLSKITVSSAPTKKKLNYVSSLGERTIPTEQPQLLGEVTAKSLVVRVPGYRTRGQGPISGATRFSDKNWCETGSTRLVSITEELHGRKISGSGLENREYVRSDPSS
jgi:hypothetical protein